MTFAGKYGPWAIVVGASAGLGASFAEGCARRGLNVALVARRTEPLEAMAADIAERHSVETRALPGDAAQPDFTETLAAATAGLDLGLLIYNCAGEHSGPFLEMAAADFQDNIRINCLTPTLIAQTFGRRLVVRGRGGLVFVTSKSALRGWPGWVSYSASKAYEMLLGEGLWGELRPHGIDAHTYVVGSTYTPAYIQMQKDLDTPFANSIDPKDYPPGTRLPRPPETVAETMFPLLGTAPRLYSHAEDEADALAFAQRPRAEVVADANPLYATAIKASLAPAGFL